MQERREIKGQERKRNGKAKEMLNEKVRRPEARDKREEHEKKRE